MPWSWSVSPPPSSGVQWLVVLFLLAVAARCCGWPAGALPASPSISSSLVCGGFGGRGPGAIPLLLARHGGEDGGGSGAAGGCWPDLQLGSSRASPGSFFTAAFSPAYLKVDGRPLPPLALATEAFPGRRPMVLDNLQAATPLWRPYGYSAVGSRLPVPSGIVPGDGEVGCAGLKNRGGAGAGPDCFSKFSSEVLGANCKGWVVTLYFLEALSVKCNPTDDVN